MIDRLAQLEGRFERLLLELQDTRRKLTQAMQQIRDLQARPAGGGANTGAGYFIDPVVIGAGSSVSGQTVKYRSGGSVINATTNGTVYNEMAVATVATTGKTIMVVPYGDGTYVAVSQSC